MWSHPIPSPEVNGCVFVIIFMCFNIMCKILPTYYCIKLYRKMNQMKNKLVSQRAFTPDS